MQSKRGLFVYTVERQHKQADIRNRFVSALGHLVGPARHKKYIELLYSALVTMAYDCESSCEEKWASKIAQRTIPHGSGPG